MPDGELIDHYQSERQTVNREDSVKVAMFRLLNVHKIDVSRVQVFCDCPLKGKTSVLSMDWLPIIYDDQLDMLSIFVDRVGNHDADIVCWNEGSKECQMFYDHGSIIEGVGRPDMLFIVSDEEKMKMSKEKAERLRTIVDMIA